MLQFFLDCKIAKLKQLYTKRSNTGPKNYHPVSFLLLISKIIKKFICDQAKTILSKNKT